MPVNGQSGIAKDGTPVVWVDAAGAAIPAAQAKSVYGVTALTPQQLASGATGNPASKIAPEDTDALKKLAAMVGQQQLMSSRAQQFMKAQGSTPTGPSYADTQLDLPLVGHVGTIPSLDRLWTTMTKPDLAAQVQNMDAINQSTWALNRPTGSGPIRGFEAAGWQKAFPNVANFGTTNQAIAARMQKEAADNLSLLQFAQKYVHSGQGGYGDAVAAWQQQQQQAQAQGQAPQLSGRAGANAALQAKSAASRQQADPLGLFGN